MVYRMREIGPRLSNKDLNRFQRWLGYKIPDQYVLFLLQYNGGRPDLNCIDIPHFDGSPTDVQVFFGLNRDINVDCLEWNYDILKERLERYQLPIGTDSGGNCFIISLLEKDYGKIYYVDLESVFCDYLKKAAVYLVAENIEHFMKLLRKY